MSTGRKGFKAIVPDAGADGVNSRVGLAVDLPLGDAGAWPWLPLSPGRRPPEQGALARSHGFPEVLY